MFLILQSSTLQHVKITTPVVLAAQSEMSDETVSKLLQLKTGEEQSLLSAMKYVEVELPVTGRKVYYSSTLYPKASMARYLANLAKIPARIGKDGTLDISDPELRGWVNRMFNTFVPSFEAEGNTAFQIKPLASVSFSDGQKSLTLALAPPNPQDRAKLAKNPAKVHDPKGTPAPQEEFTKSFMGSDFRCVIVGAVLPKATERLQAIEQASSYLADVFITFGKEEARLMRELVSQLQQMNLAVDTASASVGTLVADLSPALKMRVEMCSKSFESYGFSTEDEARKFFSRAAVSTVTKSIGFFTGDPNRGGYSIGFALKIP